MSEREAERQRLLGVRVKDLSAANFIKVWRGELGGPPIGELLSIFKDFADAGSWSDDDKKRIIRIKLEGKAKRFLSSRVDLRKPETTFEQIEQALEERFKDRQPAQHHYSMFQSAVQRRGEDPHEFLDRLRALGELTETKLDDPAKQEVIRSELQRRLLAVFTNGLQGVVGEQVRYRLPETVDEELHIAVTVWTEEKKMQNSNQERKSVFATSVTCFTCNRTGHKARECRSGRTRTNVAKRPFVNNGQNNNDSRYQTGRNEEWKGQRNFGNSGDQNNRDMRRVVECYKCHKMGHIARNCNSQENPNGSAGRAPLSNQNKH